MAVKYMEGIRGVIVMTWGAPRTGREADAVTHLEGTLQLFNERIKSGSIDSARLFIDTTGNASESIGMLLIEGGFEALFGLLFDVDYQARMAQAACIAHNFTTRLMVAGDMAEKSRGTFRSAVANLSRPTLPNDLPAA